MESGSAYIVPWESFVFLAFAESLKITKSAWLQGPNTASFCFFKRPEKANCDILTQVFTVKLKIFQQVEEWTNFIYNRGVLH